MLTNNVCNFDENVYCQINVKLPFTITKVLEDNIFRIDHLISGARGGNLNKFNNVVSFWQLYLMRFVRKVICL